MTAVYTLRPVPGHIGQPAPNGRQQLWERNINRLLLKEALPSEDNFENADCFFSYVEELPISLAHDMKRLIIAMRNREIEAEDAVWRADVMLMPEHDRVFDEFCKIIRDSKTKEGLFACIEAMEDQDEGDRIETLERDVKGLRREVKELEESLVVSDKHEDVLKREIERLRQFEDEAQALRAELRDMEDLKRRLKELEDASKVSERNEEVLTSEIERLRRSEVEVQDLRTEKRYLENHNKRLIKDNVDLKQRLAMVRFVVGTELAQEEVLVQTPANRKRSHSIAVEFDDEASEVEREPKRFQFGCKEQKRQQEGQENYELLESVPRKLADWDEDRRAFFAASEYWNKMMDHQNILQL
ncbi:hypothetical protein BJ508DRAFT_308240 [Ascobolus immersus RN42]|uniref:Uncharacterized protein n=1 Tax=Ascobolus immersus RN42 TaxID=1160509 RepID=A0A3N4ID17_ASCIM|nr:hypothetical protein BJ508DRAFT_308240 [Ascobolus immersus RN42]